MGPTQTIVRDCIPKPLWINADTFEKISQKFSDYLFALS